MNLTQTFVQRAKPREKKYDVYDDTTPGLVLRVWETKGKIHKKWFISYKHPATKTRHMKLIGTADHLTVAQARERVRIIMSTLILTRTDPLETEKKQRERITLGEIVQEYKSLLTKEEGKEEENGGDSTVENLNYFKEFFNVIAEDLEPLAIEKWKTKQKKFGNPRTPKEKKGEGEGKNKGKNAKTSSNKINNEEKPVAKGNKNSSINRRLTSLFALLNWAVRMALIAKNPLKGRVSKEKVSNDPNYCFLSSEERERLLDALEKRDAQKKDYFKTAVLVSLNTGIRKGTLLQLLWEDIDFERQTLILRSEIMKSGNNAEIPLNEIAFQAFLDWRKRSGRSVGFIFPGKPKINKDGSVTETHLGDVKKPWNTLAKKIHLKDFSWHGLRHDFGSQLAMLSVDLNTIKELMCHKDLKMTLVYAHLSPLHKKIAADKLATLYKKSDGI